MLLQGDGVHLRSRDGIDQRLDQPLVPFAFPGEHEIDASLTGSASSDFNIMTRRATTVADVQVVIARQTLRESSAGVLFAAHGQWDIRRIEGEPRSINFVAGGGLWWEGEPIAWELVPHMTASALIAILVRSRTSPIRP